MSQEYYETKDELAKCFLTRLSERVKMPSHIYELLKQKGRNIVAVIPGKSKKMTFFVTDADKVLFIRLTLERDSLNDVFFISLRETLKNLSMSNLFSTGLCFKDEVCVWEGIFEFGDSSDLEKIKENFRKIKHVKKAQFELIKVEEN